MRNSIFTIILLTICFYQINGQSTKTTQSYYPNPWNDELPFNRVEKSTVT